MATDSKQAGKASEHGDKVIEIKVNRKPVKITKGDHTGLEIKDTAIEQQVAIGRDFILSLEKGEGEGPGKDEKPRIIGDADVVKVHENMRFRAVDDDDNS